MGYAECIGKAEGTKLADFRAAQGRLPRGAESDLGVCFEESWLGRGLRPHIPGRWGIVSKGRQMLKSLLHVEFEVKQMMSQFLFIQNVNKLRRKPISTVIRHTAAFM